MDMPPCIFCQIISGENPARVVYRDEQVTVFHDIRSATPVHLLIVPNKHIPSVNHLSPQDESLVGHMISVARQVAIAEGIHEKGYRLIINTGSHGGQTVFHLHIHLLGGRRMRFPLG